MRNKATEHACKLTRSGNSLCIRLPREVVDRLRLREGDAIRVRVSGNSITIRWTAQRKTWIEKDLLKGVTPAICGPDLIPDRAGRELI
jgi:antitoxin component of MazEF toxin-antitoxin module